MRKRPALTLALCLLLGGAAQAQSNRARLVALLFDGNAESVASAAEVKPGDATVESVQRTSAAVRALRKAFLDEGVIDPLPFSLETPTIARALLDAKVNLAPGIAPTEAEKIRIAAACGASYVISANYSITTMPVNDPADPGATQKVPTLDVEALEVKAGKVPTGGKKWHDSMRVSDSLSTAQVARREGLSDALNTAARTLVLRFLSIPTLRELRRRTPSTELLPRPLAPPTAPDASEENPPELRAEQARVRAETILKEGNIEEGIRALRRAINLAPRTLAPRLALVRVWEQLKRPDRLEEEARRALDVADPAETPALRSELVLLLGSTQRTSGDLDGAKESFEEALRLDGKSRDVRLALAQIFLSKGDLDSAEPHLLALVNAKPSDIEATLGLARLLTLRSDFEGAQARLTASGIAADQRTAFATGTFLETAMRLAARLTQNRASFEQGTLDKATFLTALKSQLKRATPLQKLLASSPPPKTAPANVQATHRHFGLAAALLLQAMSAMQTHLETGDKPAAAQSRLYLGEFFREMNEAASGGEGGA